MHGISIEDLAEVVHKAYCVQYKKVNGITYWTNGDYNKLDEEAKEYDRATVKAVLNKLKMY